MKKVSVIIAVVLLAIIIGGLYYIKKQKVPEFNVIKIIPSDVAFFIDIQNTSEFVEEIMHDNNIWDELKNITSVKKFENQVVIADSLLNLDKSLGKVLQDRRAILAGERIGKNSVHFLLAMRLENLREQNQLENYFQHYAQEIKSQVTSNVYNGVKTFQVQRSNKNHIHYAFVKGILLIGNSKLIVEDAIRQSEVKTSINSKKNFNKVAETAGKNVTANLYLNYKNLPDIFQRPINQKYASQLALLKNFGSWSALDVNIKTDALLLNGFSSDNPDEAELADLFKNQEPVDQEIEKVLPANTATFLNLGISDKKKYMEQYKAYLRKTDNLDTYHANLRKINSKYGIEAEKEIFDLLHEEIGIAFLNGNTNDPKEKAFILLKTKGKRFAEQTLGELSKKVCTKANEKPNKQTLKIDKETSYTAYKMPVDNLIGTLFGEIFDGIDNSYFTFTDNYVVFGKSPEMLQEFIYSNILNKTLENDHQYNQFDDYLSDNSNFHFYCNMYRSPQLISHYLNPEIQKGIEENLGHIRKFQAFAYQFMGSEDMIYNNLFIKYIPKVSEEPKTVWECHLDTSISIKPAFVTNHYTGEKEIFVQDKGNKIYLINKVGRVLWEKQLNEQVMSDIYQIDFYRNGKLQILFNTKSRIHLIDREGNYVERYPINLPSPATTGLSVFDYNNNKDYRVFIPCDNRKVYDFNKEGDILDGWIFGKTDTKVTAPVQYFRIGTKDYIVFADQYRVYILNRRGETRVEPEKQFTKSKHNSFVLEEKNNRTEPRLVTTDPTGRVYYIYFDGKVEASEIHEFSENHYFDYQDMNSDDLKDFIFLDNNKLEVFEGNGKELFKRKFDAEISNAPIYFYFSFQDRKLGVVSEEANEIYLLNNDGDLYDGFPLKGNTPFSIGYLEQPKRNFNLIVGNKYSFVYNYSVN